MLSLRDQASISAKQAMKDIRSARKIVFHDCSLAAAMPHHRRGPRIFRSLDLLSATPTLARADNIDQEHSINQLLLGSTGSSTSAHVDFMGADGFLQLVVGEKLWIIAPPEHHRLFFELFERSALPFDRFPPATIQLMYENNFQLVHQRAGDIVYVPGGWPHAVKNRTMTVAFGCSYIRPWKLHRTLDFIEMHLPTHESIDEYFVNVWGLFDSIKEGDWSITDKYRSEVVARAQKARQKYKRAYDSRVNAANAKRTAMITQIIDDIIINSIQLCLPLQRASKRHKH